VSKQRIPPRKRYALWIAHKGICSYCKELLRYKDVWIDHILPAHLLKNPDRLAQVLKEYDLSSDFDIEDYCNWLPTHWRCNLDKAGNIFDQGTTRYYINIARERLTTAQDEEQKIIRDLRKDKLVGSLEIALSEGLLSKKAIFAILEQEPTPKVREDPIIITFGLNYNDLWESESHPNWLDNYDPVDYPSVCDLLEKDLVKQIKSLLSCEFFYPEASNRNGETLSVRLAFVRLDKKEIGQFMSDWWEILEFTSYSDVYREEFYENSSI